ncbi:hypothetical protein [Comamonas sp.]|uniref:helix-turn-helix transcriptional regulator n=1 Tax=Comamonas sp. TaxID=34028 RepID=UPI0028AC6FB2|nr:hypothetical protein [Comamonas sp.]
MRNAKFSYAQLFFLTYHGKANGLMRVSTKNEKLLVRGHSFPASQTDSGALVFAKGASNLPPLSVDAADGKPHAEFLARGHRTGKLYAISGKIEKVMLRSTSTKSAHMPNTEYEAEMARVKSARAADVDPMVSVRFAARHSGRSVASIYRDMKNGSLQKPFKLGNASNWPFSVIDAYARGERATPPL